MRRSNNTRFFVSNVPLARGSVQEIRYRMEVAKVKLVGRVS
jgi:hypothetical protein